MLKYYLATAAFVFCFLSFQTASAQALTLNYFTASPSGPDVLVAWELPEEAGVNQMKLLRKIEGEADFKTITTVLPNGGRTYEFTDVSLFKDVPKLVSYQLQVNRNGMVYSYYTAITYNPTSVSRTWGSIKAMFR